MTDSEKCRKNAYNIIYCDKGKRYNITCRNNLGLSRRLDE